MKGSSGDERQNLSLLTGGTGGTYYPLGGQIGNIITDNTNANITPQTSGASAENMETLRAGEAEIAFSQTDIAAYAVEAKEMFKGNPIDNIQAISSLYPETVQLVTTAKSGIKSVEDLKGKKVSVGAPGSGAYINAMQILALHGLSAKDIKAQNLSFDESTDGIQAGNIDAAFITAGTPTGAVEAFLFKMILSSFQLRMKRLKSWLRNIHIMQRIPFRAALIRLNQIKDRCRESHVGCKKRHGQRIGVRND